MAQDKKVLKFYPAEDVKSKVVRKDAAGKKFAPGTAKLRASITPGTVLILLAGRFKGKRVVFLKQLPSGLLLVTGPYKVNGVPARRVNQAYVIATSTKVDVSGIDTKAFTDDYFKRAETSKKAKTEEGFWANPAKQALSDAHKKNQKALDDALIAKVNGVPHLKQYLNSRFTLQDQDRPHLMKF